MVQTIKGIQKIKTGEPLDIASGVVDLVSGIANFLPPPASIVTGSISSVFALFSGTPSVSDVVKEEFDSLKTFITDGLEEQKTYIKHAIELSQIDEMIRISQAVLDTLTLKMNFLNAFSDTNVTSLVTSQIRDEMDVFGSISDISLFRITYDDLCKR